jgi:hypothetical protein
MISEEEKATLGEKLKMYDPLWDEHPRVKKIYAKAATQVAEGRLAAKAEVEEAKAKQAEAKAKLEAELAEQARAKLDAMKTHLQKAMVYVIGARFPEITELAQQRARQIENPEVLSFLLEQVESAVNEIEARGILRLPAA